MAFARSPEIGRLRDRALFKDIERRLQERKKASFRVVRFRVPAGIMENADVYNPTAPFRGVIAGRVEKRDSEHSKSVFFRYDGNAVRDGKPLDVDDKAPVFDNLQDPFFSDHGSSILFGGVKIISKQKDSSTFRTVIFKAGSVNELDPNNVFAQGPVGEKDIRVLQLEGDSIIVSRRPQGGEYGRGKIYYQLVKSIGNLPKELETLDNMRYLSTPKLDAHYAAGGWAGINQMLMLEDGSIGIVGHLGMFEESGDKNYKAFAMKLDPKTGIATEMKIIADIGSVPKMDPKHPDLSDVVFPGGIARHENGMVSLFLGVRDSYAVELAIPDPFLSP